MTSCVVVSGVTGFLGSRLAKKLVEAQYKVIGLKRPTSSLAHIEYVGLGKIIELHNVTDAGLESFFRERNVSTVFHTASLARVGDTDQEIAALIDSNLKFPTLLAQQAKRAGVRSFINASTSWQSIDGKAYSPFNLYAATKEAFENILIAIAAKDFTCVSLRLFDTYGPGDNRNKIVDLLVKAVLSGQELLMSPGEQAISLVHIDDVAAAFIVANNFSSQEKPSTHGVFSVPAKESIKLRELAELISALSVKPIPIKWGGRPYRPNEIMLPSASQAIVPGWHPIVSLKDGLAEMVEAWKA